MLVSELIRDAYILGKILDASGIGYDAPEMVIGLTLLNRNIDDINVDGQEIVINDSLVIDAPSDTYTLNGWVGVSSATYRIGNVETPMKVVDLGGFYDDAYLNDITSIPYMGYFARKDLEVLELNFYFNPGGDYPVTIHGIKSISNLSLNDDIDSKLKLYKSYLQELLIRDLRAYNTMGDDSRNVDKISELESRLMNIKDVNRSVETSPLNSFGETALDKIARESLEGNLFRGFRPC